MRRPPPRWLVVRFTADGPMYLEKREGGSTWSSNDLADAELYPLWRALLVSMSVDDPTVVVSGSDGVTRPWQYLVGMFDNGRAFVQCLSFMIGVLIAFPCRWFVDWVADLAQVAPRSLLVRGGGWVFLMLWAGVLTNLVLARHGGRLAAAYERWRGRKPPVRVQVVVPAGSFGGPDGILGHRIAIGSDLIGVVVEATEITEAGSMRLVIELPPGTRL